MEFLIGLLLIAGIVWFFMAFPWVFWLCVVVGIAYAIWSLLPAQRAKRKREREAREAASARAAALFKLAWEEFETLFKSCPGIIAHVRAFNPSPWGCVDDNVKCGDGEPLANRLDYRGLTWRDWVVGDGRTWRNGDVFDEEGHNFGFEQLKTCLEDMKRLVADIRQREADIRQREKFLKGLEKIPTSTRPHLLGYRVVKQLRMVRVDDCDTDNAADLRLREEAHKAGGDGIINMKVRPYPGGKFSAEGDAVLLEAANPREK